MRKRWICAAAVLAWSTADLVACTSDTTTPESDGGVDASVSEDTGTVSADTGTSDAPGEAAPPAEAGANDAGTDGAPSDAGSDAADAGPVGPFLTLSYTFNSFGESAYEVFNPTTGAEQGSLTYAQFGTNLSSNASPWVLEQYNDLVLQMDPVQPWKVRSSWSVVEPAPIDAGASAYSDAFSVAEVGTKAYVALFTRNYIAVLDTSTAADGGAPLKSISLSQFVSDADVDHGLEAIAIFYDKTQHLVWAVLGNTNQAVSSATFPALTCVPGFNPLVVAIDPTTDTIVSEKTYSLSGFDVYPSGAVAFDQAGDRLLAASQGCSNFTTESDGAVNVGPTVESYVEALSLTTGNSSILLNPAPAGAGALLYVDATHAFIQWSGGVNAWDPTQATLGAPVPNAPDAIVYDGHGHLLGPTMTTDDGGTSFSLISVDTADGGVIMLSTTPLTPTPDPSSYTWEGVDLWPRP